MTVWKALTGNDVKKIRQTASMTQTALAEFLGVSLKTVEAWESGYRKPGGAACRLLCLVEANPEFPKLYDQLIAMSG